MSNHMEKLLNISRITKRNHNLPLVCMGKVCCNALIFQLVYAIICSLLPFDTSTSCQKLMRRLWLYALFSVNIPIR